ncbi:uncharacterized protein LOC107718233 [Sinocyclocheilus rhinocerous]|uniref:uncharacterized protein LOC107718233 n=1 Tax=Sinocyclocheilus rhinocerous TaxID=307959 RepID=UPI0007B8C8BC|nr:PREDICTED: uncharacterized protein LOC107718233 [Sinocyclocheilus rhinocerous]
MDMLLQQTDCRHSEREAYYHYLTNFTPRQESGCYSEVNILVLSEVTTKSVSMKLRRNTVLRSRRRQQREHVKDSESICVVLSDTDSSQSESVEEIKDHVSVIHDMKRPVRKSRAGASCRARKEDERPLSLVEQQHGAVQKISLAPDAMAEDTLEKLRLRANTSETKTEVESRVELESVLDESSTDLTVESGPSSPSCPVDTVRCRECQRLFAKMRKQPTPKQKSRDTNPASLSCDVWVLLKKWHPQRLRHREKGLNKQKEVSDGIDGTRRVLMFDDTPETVAAETAEQRKSPRQKHKRGEIREAQNEQQEEISEDSDGFRTPTDLFSVKPKIKRGNQKKVSASGKPAVQKPNFMSMNLRRCKDLLSVQTNLSITKAKPRHRKRSRSVVWPPVAGWQFSVKRKPSLNSTLSQQLYPLDLSVGVKQKDKLLVDDKISRLNADLKQNSDVSSKQRTTNVRGKSNKQEVSDGIDGTRRVLMFDDTPETVAAETAEQRKSPRQKHKRGEIREAQNEQQEEISEDSDGFRTPTDLFSVKPKIKRGNQKKVSTSGKPAVQKPNFMSMLATLVKNPNQIIKESCK